jgi:hypothetical protein
MGACMQVDDFKFLVIANDDEPNSLAWWVGLE